MSPPEDRPAFVSFCAVSINSRIAIQDCGTERPIIEVQDAAGAATTNESEAAFLLVDMGDDWHVLIDISEFAGAALH